MSATKITLVIFILVAASAILLSSSMSRPLMHDEGMYCTAGVLVAQGKLPYRDFAYVSQLPFHPLLYAAVYKIFTTDYYLLAARLLSVAADIGTVIVIFLIYLRTLRPNYAIALFFGVVAVILYMFNTFVLYANGLAWNHDIIVLCVVLAFFIFTADRIKPSWQTVLAAALLTLASFMRATTAVVWVVFLCFTVLKPGVSLADRLKMLAIYLCVSLLVAIWPLYIIAQAPAAFYVNIFLIPAFNGAYLHKTGMAYDKIPLILSALTRPDYLALIILAAGFWIFALVRCRRSATMQPMFLAVAVVMAFAVVAVLPPTMWLQYFAPAVPFVVISLAYPLAHLYSQPHNRRRYLPVICVLAAAIPAIVNYARMPQPTALAAPRAWAPLCFHQTARNIATEVGKGNHVLTLCPLIALEGGLRVYPELSAGVFSYRVADFLTPQQRDISKTVGPNSIPQLAQTIPPKAVLTGVEPDFLEEPLRGIPDADWQHRTFSLDDTTLLLFYKPAPSK